MLSSHYRAISYDCHDSQIVTDRETQNSMFGNSALRVDALGYEKLRSDATRLQYSNYETTTCYDTTYVLLRPNKFRCDFPD